MSKENQTIETIKYDIEEYKMDKISPEEEIRKLDHKYEIGEDGKLKKQMDL